MKSELYNKWIESHSLEKDMPDISDAVMSRIEKRAYKPGALKRAWEVILLDIVQTRTMIRTCVLISGAFMGLLRMLTQIYAVLFT